MEKLNQLILDALSLNNLDKGLSGNVWAISRIKNTATDDFITVVFYPKGMTEPPFRMLSFATNLINDEEIEAACKFIECNLDKELGKVFKLSNS